MQKIDREFWKKCIDDNDDLNSIFLKILEIGYTRDEAIKILGSGEFFDVLFDETETEIDEENVRKRYEEDKKNIQRYGAIKTAAEKQFYLKNKDLWGDCFDAFNALHVHAVFLNSEYYDDLIKILPTEVKEETGATNLASRHIYARACQIYAEIGCLLQNGFADGAFARWRSLFELLVSLEFILKYGEKTARAYFSVCNPSEKEKDFEWAKASGCFRPESKVNITELYKKTEIIQDFITLDVYRSSHKIVHASPIGTFNGVGIRENEDTLLEGPSEWGMSVPANLTVRTFVILSSIYFSRYNIEKWLTISGSLIYWIRDIEDAFAKQSEINGDLEIVGEGEESFLFFPPPFSLDK